MTPPELQRIASRMYGRKHWRSRLALNLGLDNSTVWRATKKEKIPFLMEVAVRGLDERHKLLRQAARANDELLRQQGQKRPRLRLKATPGAARLKRKKAEDAQP